MSRLAQEPMYYDLDTLTKVSQELGFQPSQISPYLLEIPIFDNAILVFQNFYEQKDKVMGFKGTPSHYHDKIILMLDEKSYIELNELDILVSIKNGDVLIMERYLNHTLEDRWFNHKLGKVDVKYIEAGEEIRIRRIA